MSPKILYPYHPLFGVEHEIFGFAGGKRDMVYVRLADHSTRGVPAWMFDPAVCSGVRFGDRPVIACDALLNLSRLLDRGSDSARSGEDGTTRNQSKEEEAGEA